MDQIDSDVSSSDEEEEKKNTNESANEENVKRHKSIVMPCYLNRLENSVL